MSARAGMALQIAGASMLASAVPVLVLGFLAELLVEKLHGARAPLAIAEELPATEVSVGTELTMIDGMGASEKVDKSSIPFGRNDTTQIRERVA